MAITVTNFTVGEQQGTQHTSPTLIIRTSMAGDAAYATGGSAAFEAALAQAVVRSAVEVTAVHGFGLTAGAITHFVRWDNTNGKLLAYVLAGTQVPNATDLSAVTFDLTITCR